MLTINEFENASIKIGISACLLGEKVRFDGGHKNSKYCQQELTNFFDFVPVCPEVAIGLGTPRASIRLVQEQHRISVRTGDEQHDYTEQLQAFSEAKVSQLQQLSGYILCAKSPTCGMERVTVYKSGTNQGSKIGIGIFAQELMKQYPLLPVEEEGRLNDLVIKENFFTRVYAYHDFSTMQQSGLTIQKLVQFHSRYKYLLMAHHPVSYRQLGQLVADREQAIADNGNQYFTGFMAALKRKASRKNHTSTLQHIQGYFKKYLTPQQKAELTEAVLKYHQGLQPLLVPITLINHYLKEYPNAYIEQQVYLNPHPESLRLRYAY